MSPPSSGLNDKACSCKDQTEDDNVKVESEEKQEERKMSEDKKR